MSSWGTGRPGRLPTSISSALGGHEGEHAVADERVVHDHVRGGEQPGSLHGEQVGVAGPGADEPDVDAHDAVASAAARRRRTTGSGSQVAMASAPAVAAQSPNAVSPPWPA